MKPKKTKTPNPFNNNGFSHEAWQKGYESDHEVEVKNPYDQAAGDLREFWDQGRAAKIKDIEVIPPGIYCHGPLIPDGVNEKGHPRLKAPQMCPYWYQVAGEPEQCNGGCAFLEKTDKDLSGLLWDQCKECGIKTDDEDEE